MSTTPRTDAALYPMNGVEIVWPDFARTLEIELAAAKAECERLRLCTLKQDCEFAPLVYSFRAENDRLIDENVKLTDRAEKLKKLWKEFITLMDITEESDSGYEFNPNKISSCRAMDGRRLNEILIEARQIVF